MKSLERKSSYAKKASLDSFKREHSRHSLHEPGYPRRCEFCEITIEFYTSSEFTKHIRLVHSTQEGGSFLCRYGENDVCLKLPPEGVCDVDFEAHIRRCHASFSDFSKDDDCLSMRSIRLTSETPTDFSERRKFTLSSFTQNLSAVLADPGRSRNETSTFFTRHWGDGFVPLSSVPLSKKVPAVSAKHFDDYKRTTGEAYVRYRSIRRALRLSYGEGGSTSNEKQDADDLPTIFVDPRFALSDADTFAAIFTVPHDENLDALRQTLSGRSVVPATPTETGSNQKSGSFRDYSSLQSRLEMMHDIVDGRLANKLVSKTDAFWQVVRSYSGLQEQLAVAMKSVKAVRSNLRQVDELVCDRTKAIVVLHEKSESKRKLLAKLHDISCLREAQSTVQMMLSQGDYPKALTCIETSLDVLLSQLDGVTCFRHLASQLRELYDVIGRMMNEDFASLIQKELGVKPESGTLIQSEGELSAVMLGLMRMRKYSFVTVLREEIAEGVKNIMRQVVKNHILNSGIDLSGFDPSLAQLGEPVRRMKQADYVSTVCAAMNEQYEFCKRLEAMQELILEIAERVQPSTDGPQYGKTPFVDQASIEETKERIRRREAEESDPSDDELAPSSSWSTSFESFGSGVAASSSATAAVLLSIDIRSDSFLRKIVPLIAEYGHQCAQQRLSRLLIARAKDTSVTEATTPTELCEVLKHVDEYQTRCADSGWYSTQSARAGPLGRAVTKVSMDYIERFHISRKAKIGNMLDTELWKSAEVPAIDQIIMDSAVESGRLRSPRYVDLLQDKMRDWTPEKKPMTHLSRSASSATMDSQSGVAPLPSQSLSVGEDNFVVVGTSLTMIRVLADYCEAIEHMPLFAQDWNSRVVEVLKTFNSRCCQLILGAGALQLVGLKTISVRNLALASRSLELIARLVPFVRDELDRVLSDDRKNLLRYFRQVENDYSEHIGEITTKLISVIDHYTTNCLGMWEVKGTIPSTEFTQICKHMTKFHNGLFGIMPEQQIKNLFQRVHENFKANLREHLNGMGITPHDSLKFGYVTQDYMYYQQNMCSMKSCQGLELESLNDILFSSSS